MPKNQVNTSGLEEHALFLSDLSYLHLNKNCFIHPQTT